MTISKLERTKRASINGTRHKLRIRGQEPGFVYRIVNDIDDRVSVLQERGYEIVTDKTVTVGDKRIANPTQEGSPVKVSVGNGVQAYVMRIKDEWHKEDQAAKNEQIDKLEEAMYKDNKSNDFYGKLKITKD